MSLCYDFQKWTIISMLAILTVCFVGIVNLVYGQTAMDEANKLIEALGNATYIDDPATKWNETAEPERTEAEIEKKNKNNKR